MSFKILVADDLAEEGLSILREAGEVTFKKGMDENALRETLSPFHALVVRSATVVTARSLEHADHLAVIGRAGIGVDNIDVDAATARGIVVMNTPEAGAVTTGEHALALLMSMCRNIPAADASVREGRWEKGKFIGVEMRGKTLGILGFGRIGRVVADRARSLGMEIVAYDPWVKQAQAPAGVRMLDLDEFLSVSDFVTVHAPLSDETRHLLDAERMAKMKPGARLVHAARGGIVDESALFDALESGHLAGAALDVFEREPLDADARILKAPNTVLTPHLGASTAEAKRNVSLDVARQVALCLMKGIALNGVNVPRIDPAEAAQVKPYMDLAQNLATFLVQVFDGPLNSLRLTIQGGLPESAHRPLTVAMVCGALRPRLQGPVTPVNAERVANDQNVRIHCEASSMKRDFMNMLRVEALLGSDRHHVSGTVLGHRHGRMVELDHYLLDAIPEGPMLVTFHRDQPGVLGSIGTLLGEQRINIARMQLGTPEGGAGPAVGIFNLDQHLAPDQLRAIASLDAIERACQVL